MSDEESPVEATEAPGRKPNGCLIWFLIVVGIAVAIGTWSYFNDRSEKASHVSDYANTHAYVTIDGGEWPLTVDHGSQRCIPELQAVVYDVDGHHYAVNGAARAAGFEDITPIWKSTGSLGLRVNIGPLIKAGLAMC